MPSAHLSWIPVLAYHGSGRHHAALGAPQVGEFCGWSVGHTLFGHRHPALRHLVPRAWPTDRRHTLRYTVARHCQCTHHLSWTELFAHHFTTYTHLDSCIPMYRKDNTRIPKHMCVYSSVLHNANFKGDTVGGRCAELNPI